MAIGDPFDTTYAGSMKAGLSLGEGVGSAAKAVGTKIGDNQKRQMAFDTLKAAGMIKTKTEEPSLDELEQNAKEFAKSQGHELVINKGDNPEQAKQHLMGIYKALNIPLPKGKTTTELNLSPGTEYDPIKGEVSFKNPKSLLSGFGLSDTSGLDKVDSYKAALAEHGLELAGIDQKGQPMIRQIKRDVQAEKFDAEKADNQKKMEEKSQFVKDQAKDTLGTLAEVEKGINNFGLMGGVPAVPGTDKYTWQSNVDKLLSGKVISLMTQMKEASKTGATGFGQLSEKELQVLQNASTALKRGLKPEEAQKYINQMKESVQKIIGNEASGGGAGTSFASEEEAHAANLAPGTKITINGRPAVWE